MTITRDQVKAQERRRDQPRREPGEPKVRRARSAPRVAPRRESEIQREILTYLSLVPGVVAWRNNTGAMFGEHKGKRWAVRFGRKGLPDILGFRRTVLGCDYNGCVEEASARFLAIEVKRDPKQKPTPEQAAFLDSVRKAGGIALVASSVDDVRKELPTP